MVRGVLAAGGALHILFKRTQQVVQKLNGQVVGVDVQGQRCKHGLPARVQSGTAAVTAVSVTALAAWVAKLQLIAVGGQIGRALVWGASPSSAMSSAVRANQ